MITEQYVLEHCLHNTDEMLENVFFPQFKNELEHTAAVVSAGYYTPLFYREPVTFEQWKVLRYAEIRRARYAPIAEQLDMLYHDSVDGTKLLFEHIGNVKQLYPKE